MMTMMMHQETKRFYDVKNFVKTLTFKVFDKVWLREAVFSKIKLSHKVEKKFVGLYLILEAYPTYSTYKLQNCATKKTLPLLIYAN